MNAFAPRWLQVVEQIACCLEPIWQQGNGAETNSRDGIQVRFRLATADTCTYALGDGRDCLSLSFTRENAVRAILLDAIRRCKSSLVVSPQPTDDFVPLRNSVLLREAREHCVQLSVITEGENSLPHPRFVMRKKVVT